MVTNVGSTFIFYLGKNSWNNVFRMNVLQDVMGDNLCFLCYLNNVFGKSFESIIFRRVPPPTHTHLLRCTYIFTLYISFNNLVLNFVEVLVAGFWYSLWFKALQLTTDSHLRSISRDNSLHFKNTQDYLAML